MFTIVSLSQLHNIRFVTTKAWFPYNGYNPQKSDLNRWDLRDRVVIVAIDIQRI